MIQERSIVAFIVLYISAFIVLFIVSVLLKWILRPWWYRKTSVGEQFFMTKKTKLELYDIRMVPSFLMFRESLKNKNRGAMFFNKLDVMVNDLRRYPPDSEFYMETHSKILAWLKNKDQLIVSEPIYIDKRFYALRKFMILNITGHLFERIPFYSVKFKVKGKGVAE
jgi:hypothetical protein